MNIAVCPAMSLIEEGEEVSAHYFPQYPETKTTG